MALLVARQAAATIALVWTSAPILIIVELVAMFAHLTVAVIANARILAMTPKIVEVAVMFVLLVTPVARQVVAVAAVVWTRPAALTTAEVAAISVLQGTPLVV